MVIFDIESQFANNHDAIMACENPEFFKGKIPKDSWWDTATDTYYSVKVETKADLNRDELQTVSTMRIMENSKNYNLSNVPEVFKVEWDGRYFIYTFFFLNAEEC